MRLIGSLERRCHADEEEGLFHTERRRKKALQVDCPKLGKKCDHCIWGDTVSCCGRAQPSHGMGERRVKGYLKYLKT